ncbi:MAG: DNA polymerase III subunit gamma/tau [Myxococcota bacterium]
MSYEVLARRFRPQTFEEVAGQTHVTQTLANALRSDRLPHALLLAGPRGVGKTSIARILARSLNCDEGPTVNPCGRCAPCREIAASTSMDVQEVDAASHTGVDRVREILDSIRYAAAPGKHRIFIIDEVHMLSTAAFNALLKTLEEPPPRSLFILATTDPQKIPATVLSRVQRFDLKRLGAAELLESLRRITTSEGIEVSDAVLHGLIREADGSLRDALTLLDRLVSGLGASISDEDARTVLDLIDRRMLLEILDPVLAQDPAAALVALRRALDHGVEPARLAADLLDELRHHLVACLVEDPEELLPLAGDDVLEIQKRARAHEAETFQRLFRVLLTRLQQLAWAPRAAHVLEMAIVRLATLATGETLSSLILRLQKLERDGPRPPGPPAPAGPPKGSGEEHAGARRGSGARSGAAAGARRGRPPEPRAVSRAERSSEARLRQEAKADPVVQQVIDLLDAEIREIRTPRERSDV